ncbi:HNH endonuclease [Paraburkholderia susongensis]|uniref:HNH endonuclease n=1 Tax=Paraburkholderia susongensis TaxID=1515439 RepID=UPI003B8315E4
MTTSGYCEAHAEEGRGWSSRNRASRHKRGYDAAWVRKRDRILARDCGLCQPCLKRGRTTAATQVDHIVPKFEDGTDDDDNLQSICDDCHEVKTKAERLRAMRHRGRASNNGGV